METKQEILAYIKGMVKAYDKAEDIITALEEARELRLKRFVLEDIIEELEKSETK